MQYGQYMGHHLKPIGLPNSPPPSITFVCFKNPTHASTSYTCAQIHPQQHPNNPTQQNNMACTHASPLQLHHKKHTTNECRYLFRKLPRIQPLHGFHDFVLQDHANASPHWNMTSSSSTLRPWRNHSLYHLELESTIHPIHVLPRPRPHHSWTPLKAPYDMQH